MARAGSGVGWLELGTGSPPATKGTGTRSPSKPPSEEVAGPNELKLSDRGWPSQGRNSEPAQRPASVRWSAWLGRVVAPLVTDELAVAHHRLDAALRTLLIVARWIVQLAFNGAAVTTRSALRNRRMEKPLLTKRNTQILALGVAVVSLSLRAGQSIGPVSRHHLAEHGNKVVVWHKCSGA